MQAFQWELPVVFRPHTGEALSSWLARIAGVYHLDLATLASECLDWKPNALAEIDLAPSATTLDDLSRLTRADQSIVAHCTVRGVNPDWLPDSVLFKQLGCTSTIKQHSSRRAFASMSAWHVWTTISVVETSSFASSDFVRPSPSARNIAFRCGHAKNPYLHCSAATVATVHDSLSTPETGTSIWILADTEAH